MTSADRYRANQIKRDEKATDAAIQCLFGLLEMGYPAKLDIDARKITVEVVGVEVVFSFDNGSNGWLPVGSPPNIEMKEFLVSVKEDNQCLDLALYCKEILAYMGDFWDNPAMTGSHARDLLVIEKKI